MNTNTDKIIPTLLLILLLVLFTCSCSNDNITSFSANDESITDTIPDDYIRNSDFADGEYTCRVYKDQLLLKIDGKEYIAVGMFSDKEYSDIGKIRDNYGYVQYTDEELDTLKVGDELIYDHDIRFEIESLSVEEWEYKANDPEIPSYPNGIIRLNDSYALIHCPYEYDNFGNVLNYEESEKWMLIGAEDIDKTSEVRVFVVNNVYLLEYSDKCQFEICKDDSGDNEPKSIIKEQLSSVFDDYISTGRPFCQCTVYLRDSKVVKIDLDVSFI